MIKAETFLDGHQIINYFTTREQLSEVTRSADSYLADKNTVRVTVANEVKMTHALMKRLLTQGQPFMVTDHIKGNDFVGVIRVANVIQTNGIYTHVLGEPLHKISLGNNGKGYWLSFGKASHWEFPVNDAGHQCCRFYDKGEHIPENLIIEFVFCNDVKWAGIDNSVLF